MTDMEQKIVKRNFKQLEKLQIHCERLMRLWNRTLYKKGIKFKIYRRMVRWCIWINLKLQGSYLTETSEILLKY